MSNLKTPKTSSRYDNVTPYRMELGASLVLGCWSLELPFFGVAVTQSPAKPNQAQPRLFKPIQDPPRGPIKNGLLYPQHPASKNYKQLITNDLN